MPQTNIRLVILILGVVALVSLGLIGLLAMQEKGIPDALIATLSGSTSALGALLVRGDAPSETVVVNDPTNPVPVNDEGGEVSWGGVALLCALAFVIGWLAHQAGLFT